MAMPAARILASQPGCSACTAHSRRVVCVQICRALARLCSALQQALGPAVTRSIHYVEKSQSSRLLKAAGFVRRWTIHRPVCSVRQQSVNSVSGATERGMTLLLSFSTNKVATAERAPGTAAGRAARAASCSPSTGRRPATRGAAPTRPPRRSAPRSAATESPPHRSPYTCTTVPETAYCADRVLLRRCSNQAA